MFFRLALLGVSLIYLTIVGCSSSTGLANSSTSTLGDWSPVGSRQVTRNKQFTLATHYRLQIVAAKAQGNAVQEQLQNQFTDQLARQLRRYFIQVNQSQEGLTLQAALDAARANDADVLMLASVESWPDIEPIRVQECEREGGEKELKLKPCDAIEKESEGEMALAIALYDVRANKLVDSVFAHSQRGIASFVYENTGTELEQLCKMIVQQLVADQAG